MWLVYHDLSNAWANLHKTSRDCCGQVGDCPRPKKIQNFASETFFYTWGKKILSSCTRTLSDLCMRDDSLGFEDCRFATHLLNLP